MLGVGAGERFAAAGGEGVSEAVVRDSLACKGPFSARSDSSGTCSVLTERLLLPGGLVSAAYDTFKSRVFENWAQFYDASPQRRQQLSDWHFLQAADFLGCTRLKDELICWLRQVVMEVISERRDAVESVSGDCLYMCPRAWYFTQVRIYIGE